MSVSSLENKGSGLRVEDTLQEIVAEISAGAAHRDESPSFLKSRFGSLPAPAC